MGAAAVVLLWAVLASEVAEAAVVWAAAVSAGVRLTEYAFFLCSSRSEPVLSFSSAAAGTAAGALI